MRRALALLPLLALAACDVRTADANGSDVHLGLGGDADANGGDGGNRVRIDIPGFSADVKVPGLDLGGGTDLDGVRLAPGTKVAAVDVAGDDRGGQGEGRVHMRFTNPDAPGRLIDHYARALADAGYTIDARAGDTAVHARKGGKRFDLAVTGDGRGSAGTIDVAGG